MSLFASLYLRGNVEASELLASLQIAGPAERLISARIASVGRPHFFVEDYGIDPDVAVHFTLDKENSAAARSALATAIGHVLGNMSNDVLMMYVDVPVLRRVGDTKEVRAGYESFAPAGQDDWVVRSRLGDSGVD